MAAHSENFPWPSYYGEFKFFEQRINDHSKVRSLRLISDGQYRLIKKDGTELDIFVCECYSYGHAEFVETIDKIGHLDAIIIASNWCSYTPQLKAYCRQSKIGIFNIGSFMGALNRHDYWNYLDAKEEKSLKLLGLL